MKLLASCVLAVAAASAALTAVEGGEAFRAVVGNDGVQRVRIMSGSYYFRPDHIIVKAGVPVELVVSKEPGLHHSIMLNAPAARIFFKRELDKDHPAVIRFTPRKPGRYEFYCDRKFLFFKSHREKGGRGILEVVE
jgi:plastocyanin